MNRSHSLAARTGAVAAVAAASGLLLAGCGGSSPGSASGSGSGSHSHSGSGSSSHSSGSITTAAYFPIGNGYTWVYDTTVGTLKGTSTDKVISLKSSSAGQVATLANTITAPTRITHKETLIFRPDGSIEVPLAQFGNASVTLESGTIIWPSSAQLASGTPYHDTLVMKIDEAGHSQTLRMPLTVKGEGTASVTVPAGTYQASQIAETMSSSIDGYKITLTVRTWVANGVGPVKSEVFSDMLGSSASATPTSTEELASFTK